MRTNTILKRLISPTSLFSSEFHSLLPSVFLSLKNLTSITTEQFDSCKNHWQMFLMSVIQTTLVFAWNRSQQAAMAWATNWCKILVISCRLRLRLNFFLISVFFKAAKKLTVLVLEKKVSIQMWILGQTTKSTYFSKCKQTVQSIICYLNGKYVCVAINYTGNSS